MKKHEATEDLISESPHQQSVREKKQDFRSRLTNAYTWTVLGYAFTQGMRFLSNMILVRFLSPTAFGVMALVNAFIRGLTLMSDIGTV